MQPPSRRRYGPRPPRGQARPLALAPASPRTVEPVPAAPDRLTIGQLARLSGLTTRALRHYDKLGVLRPAAVGDESGYRLYDRGQVDVARQIRVLRELEVPLDEVRGIVADPDSGDAQPRVAAPRARVEARLAVLRTAHYLLGRLAGGTQIEDAMPIRPTAFVMDPEVQRKAPRTSSTTRGPCSRRATARSAIPISRSMRRTLRVFCGRRSASRSTTPAPSGR